MLPKKYHAILFISILVMLLLLGLYLLGIDYSGGQAAARTATALARNSSTPSSQSSSSSNTAQVYRHPIVYDKLTGATNNQINDVLGAVKQTTDYPIDHYQQQQQQQQNPHQLNQPMPPPPQPEEFFNNIHRQPPGFPPLGGPPHPHMAHMMGPSGHIMQPPPPLPPNMMSTTQSPSLQQQQQQRQLGLQLAPGQRVPNSADLSDASLLQSGGASDSLPSASSLNNNARPSAALTSNSNNNNNNNNNQSQPLVNQRVSQQQQQQQQQAYYTPPIFAYNNNFDQPQQNRPLTSNDPQQSGLPYGFPNLQQQQLQQPPLGVPEVPMSLEEYNARQARLRQIGNQQHQLQPQSIQSNEVPQAERYGKPINSVRQYQPDAQFPPLQQHQQQATPVNLLADPQQQQRHKQQMLDRQILFGNTNPFGPSTQAQLDNQTSITLFPDPNTQLYNQRNLGGGNMRAPYAQAELEQQLALKQAAQNRILPLSSRIDPNQQQQQQQAAKLLTINNNNNNQQQQVNNKNERPSNVNLATSGSSATIPFCAKHQAEPINRNLELVNASSQLPILFCNEDPDYPTKEIMRALENYATERSIEQLLPQVLVQIQLAQREQLNRQAAINTNSLDLVQPGTQQLALDPLQPSLLGQPANSNGALTTFDEQQQQQQRLFPSANYEQMCRSTSFMAQPRRAKNLLGQWKIVVNLPGHKYRGIAVSQMLRIEECTRPNSECSLPNQGSNVNLNNNLISRQQSNNNNNQFQSPSSHNLLPKSRCLQHYENQRLVAWSHQQGLHLDIFRVPVACSCHIRR